MRRAFIIIAVGAGLLSATGGATRERASDPIAGAVQDASRPNDDIAADRARKPAETLSFAGVRPGMIVGEFYPGGGYFTRMLSRIVGPKGHVYAIENERWVKADAPVVAPFAGGAFANVNWKPAPFGTVDFPEKLDIAWVTQNYHDLKIARYGVVDTLAFDRQVFAALKPGGVFMVVDHEAPAGTDDAATAKLHRIERAKVIEEVTSAGFKLVAEGNFLRNPIDDHAVPIFDPKVQGHTDQYVLKFAKPRR